MQIGALTTWSKTATFKGLSGFAIKTDGTLWSWGDNGSGQLGLGNLTNYSSPVQVGALTNWSAVSGGASSTIAVKTDGTLWSWGDKSYGVLGLGNLISYSSPKQIGALTTWVTIASLVYATSAIKTDGTLWSWGRNNNFGQLGLGNLTNYSSPKQVGALTTWSKVAAGRGFVLAIIT